MNQTQDPAERLLRETFAQAEKLAADPAVVPITVRSPRRRRTPVILLAAATVGLVIGAGYAVKLAREPDPTTPPVASSSPSTATATALEVPLAVPVYAAVIRKITEQDRPAKGWPKLFVVDKPVTDIGAPTGATPRPGQPFDPALRDGLATALRDVAPIIWVPDAESSREDQHGCATTKDDGVLVVVGPIKRVGDHLEVGAHQYLACLGASWLTYRLDPTPKGWRVTDTVGPVAQS